MARNEEDEGRGPWLIISTVLVALVIVAALVLTITNVFGGDDNVQPSPPPSSTSSDASKDAKSESVCGLKPGPSSQTTLTTAPETTWRLVDGIAAPKVEGVGPGKIDSDQFGYCFAQSPTGALVAAANITVATNTPTSNRKAFEKLAVPGPGRTKVLKLHESGQFPDARPEGVTLQIVGFHVDRYTPTEATIDLAFAVRSASGESYASSPIDLRRVDGDWKILVNDDGAVFDSQPVDDLAGYVLWSGV